jgi:hypothetical protein
MKPGTKSILILAYAVLSVIGILHHELTIDEAHHWLLARDSGTLAQLIDNTRIEGHPLLWSFLLFCVAQVTDNPVGMQFLQVSVSIATVWLFVRKAPFPLLFKTLFVFGYFMFFEYNLISRNYMLGVLFLFAACSVFGRREHKFTTLCLLLALAANVHAVFAIVAFAVFMALYLEIFLERRPMRTYLPGMAVFLAGLALVALQVYRTDSSWLLDPINKMPFMERLAKGFVSLFKGIVAVPDFRTLYFWNSNLIVNLSRPLASVLALFIYLLPLALFRKNRKTLFFVYAALAGLQVFFFVTQRAATRFHGATYIIIILALWMETAYKKEHYRLGNWLKMLDPLKQPLLYAILGVHFFSGVAAYAIDLRYPFTSAKATVDFLKTENLAGREIVTTTCDGTLISAYIGRKIYFLCEGSYQSFCHWNEPCAGVVTPEKARAMLADYIRWRGDAIFVSYYPLPQAGNGWATLDPHVHYRLLQKFDVNMVDKSYYYVYELKRSR